MVRPRLPVGQRTDPLPEMHTAYIRLTHRDTQNDSSPNPALLRRCVHTSIATADTDIDSLSSDLFHATAEVCLFYMVNSLPLLLWRFLAVVPWLAVIFDDIKGVLGISKTVVYLSLTHKACV